MTASGAGPAKDPARIRAMFDQIAPRYDLLTHLLSLGRDIAWRRRAARRVAALAPPGPVLDAATGTGDLLLALDRALPVGVPLVGGDVSAAMLVRAAVKTRRRCRRPLLLRTDARRLPFPDATLAAVTIAFGLRNLPDLETGVRELVRVLRPDGILAVATDHEGYREQIAVLFRSVGGGTTWSRTAVPVLGRLLSWKSAYRYLPDSIEAYVTHEELARILKRAGALPVENHTFTGGVCTLVIGRRTDRDPT